MDMGLGGPWELVIDREAWCAVVHGVAQRVGHEWAIELKCHLTTNVESDLLELSELI